MAYNKIQFKDPTPDTTRAPSPIIWSEFPIDQIKEDPGKGMYVYDDFLDFPLIGTQTTQIGFGKYKVFATTGATVVPVHNINSVEVGGGALKLGVIVSTSATIAQAYQQFRITGVGTDMGPLAFECCVAIQATGATTQGFFIGLAENDLFTLATAVPLNGGAATINNSGAMLGFQVIETGPTVINTVVSDRATSFTNIQTTIDSFSTTAYTFKKLGFIYDPTRTARPFDCIRFFSDGVQSSTYYKSTDITGTTNLKAGSLGLIASAVGTGTGGVFMKWWRCAQLYPA